MRRSLLVFLLVSFIVVTFLLHSVSTLISLLFEDASADAIPQSEIPALNSTVEDTRPHLIPKIIHQTYKNESIPQNWKAAQESCIDLHPDYKYILWTDAMSSDFIAKEYPWFLPTFAGYKNNIQRADAIRYFVLAHYGGVYIDLDDGCKRRLDPLLSYNAFLRRTVPTGISNDVMGAVPQHPFFLRVMDSLQGADRSWVLPYITIMASTGPLFLSVMWKKWMGEHANLDPEDWAGRIRVLMPTEYTGQAWSFFVAYKGDSWHGDDAKFIFWMGKNWVLLTVVGFALAGVVGLGIWWIYSRAIVSPRKRPSSASPRIGGFQFPPVPRIPLWRRRGGGKARKQDYELVAQHDA